MALEYMIRENSALYKYKAFRDISNIGTLCYLRNFSFKVTLACLNGNKTEFILSIELRIKIFYIILAIIYTSFLSFIKLQNIHLIICIKNVDLGKK